MKAFWFDFVLCMAFVVMAVLHAHKDHMYWFGFCVFAATWRLAKMVYDDEL
jgi:hypothetical protein